MNGLLMITGRITKDIVLNKRGNGDNQFDVVDNSIAYRLSGKRNGESVSDFYDFSATNGHAQTLSKYCKKGSLVQLIGEPQTSSWEDSQTKEKRSRKILKVNQVVLLESASGNNQNNNSSNNQSGRFQSSNQQNQNGSYQQNNQNQNNGGFNQNTGFGQTQNQQSNAGFPNNNPGGFGGFGNNLGQPDFARSNDGFGNSVNIADDDLPF
ncbi:single-stranded DNA-binding protein [Enterococcus casseliflavus]|uniref:single-stranded DNA-binding protein n=1 Tax=Enterococcus casseliflavus TaxID=37734 RepID=UPI0039A73C8F